MELRHNGNLVEKFENKQDANEFVSSQTDSGWTVEDDRPVTLLCNGARVDTFHDVESAEKARDERIAALREQVDESRSLATRLRIPASHNPNSWTIV